MELYLLKKNDTILLKILNSKTPKFDFQDQTLITMAKFIVNVAILFFFF